LNWQDLSALNNFGVNKDDFRSFLLPKDKSFEIETKLLSIESLKKIELFSISEFSISIVRDFENLKWRFFDNPSNQYFTLNLKNDDIELVLIYKEYNNSVDIMEVFYNTKDIDFKNISLMRAFESLFHNGFEQINVWSNLYSIEHLVLEKYGFKKGHFSAYFGFIPFTSEHECLLNIKNWHYRFTDSDIY
jgi:hypothetical protein